MLWLLTMTGIPGFAFSTSGNVAANPGWKEDRVSLASVVNDQIRAGRLFHFLSTTPILRRKCKSHKAKDPLEALAHKVSAKIEEGNTNGVVQFISLEELIADDSDETFIPM